MAIPKKALRESQLQNLTVGSAVNDGSHQISRVIFIDHGVQKPAFFKKLEPRNHYPELLAKISVATSLFKRIFQGKNSAEERLVFDERDQLIGTLSVAVDGFKPFNFSDEPVPLELSAREQVIPSTKTLIEKNAMETLLGRWYLDDDDAHPHNLGFAGASTADIDFDMFWYWFTIYMKEPRPVIGVPKKRISLSISDWESFPITKDAKHYHWATYQHPGQETLPTVPMSGAILPRVLPKAYADPVQFQNLAKDQKAQEQKLAAALKALLTYQPDMVRTRLTELFGDLALNYTSLDATDESLRVKYEKEFPLLCNEKTNVKSFVDFMMGLYQEHYDNLYRVVVFYMGCPNNGYGLSLPATSSALYLKPSFYQKIVDWVKEQNATLYTKDEANAKYNLDELQKRYHQVWRDAFAPMLKSLLYNAFDLTNKLNKLLEVEDSEYVAVQPEMVGKKPVDDTLTRVLDLFGTMPELSRAKIEPLISVDKDSKLREALLLLVEFTNKFYTVVKTYYEKERVDLTEEDNLSFVNAINRLREEYNLKVRQNLAITSSYANEFNQIALGLKDFAEHANFQIHLTTTDEQMLGIGAPELAHTDESVIAQFNDSLFVWAASTNANELSRLINEIIDTYYAPIVAPLSMRGRATPVKAYLAASIHEKGDNRLAYILSSGNEVGALNTLLIEHLTPLVLKTHPNRSISKALKAGTFKTDIALFTRAAVTFAIHNDRFTHLYNARGISLFYQTLFEWVGELSKPQFTGIVQAALKQYEAQLSWLTRSTKRAEVQRYCDKYGQVMALGLTFLNGAESSTFSDILLHKIIAAIQTDIKRRVIKQEQEGYKLIAQYDPAQHKTKYLAELKFHSEGPSHKIDFPIDEHESALTV